VMGFKADNNSSCRVRGQSSCMANVRATRAMCCMHFIVKGRPPLARFVVDLLYNVATNLWAKSVKLAYPTFICRTSISKGIRLSQCINGSDDPSTCIRTLVSFDPVKSEYMRVEFKQKKLLAWNNTAKSGTSRQLCHNLRQIFRIG